MVRGLFFLTFVLAPFVCSGELQACEEGQCNSDNNALLQQKAEISAMNPDDVKAVDSAQAQTPPAGEDRAQYKDDGVATNEARMHDINTEEVMHNQQQLTGAGVTMAQFQQQDGEEIALAEQDETEGEEVHMSDANGLEGRRRRAICYLPGTYSRRRSKCSTCEGETRRRRAKACTSCPSGKVPATRYGVKKPQSWIGSFSCAHSPGACSSDDCVTSPCRRRRSGGKCISRRRRDVPLGATYVLVKSDTECKSDDDYLGPQDSLQDCADSVKNISGTYFIFGKGGKAGKCYKEHTVGAESYACPEGWEDDEYDFYKL